MLGCFKTGASLVVAAGVALAMVPTVAAAPPVRMHAFGARTAGMTLAEAPAGLQSAARQALGGGASTAPGVFQKAELSASDRAVNDYFGVSVAVSGSTAVVGAYGKGAAYVFIRSGTAWTQQAKLTATGGGPADGFGVSVAISGATALVGAFHDQSSAGAAYVFVRSGTTWSQQAKLVASDGVANDFLGISVSISGSTAVVGAYGKGAAYVFAQSGTTWSQQAELVASDGIGSDVFGYAVAISGSTVVVGAWARNSATGAAYVYVASGAVWAQQAELLASDGAPGDAFGHSVAIFGSMIAVGADGQNSNVGAVYVFVQASPTWTQQAELHATVFPDAFFGRSVAISGSNVLSGAFGMATGAGTAYVFAPSPAGWSLQATLTAADAAANDRLGISVALSGTTAVAGADGKSSFSGAAYVYGLPSQAARLTASDAATGSNFGQSVAISGPIAVVGAPIAGVAGAVYVFLHSGSGWTQQARLAPADGASGDRFGSSVAISGSTIVVGAWAKNSYTGAAYIFVRSGTAWVQQARLAAADGAPKDFFGWSVAVSGSAAVVGAYGRMSQTGAAYAFARSGTKWSLQAELQPGQPGVLFGYSVALSGSTAVIGAPLSYPAGAAYVFVHSLTSWTQSGLLTGYSSDLGAAFGASVAISGSTVVVGAFNASNGIGIAYLFVRSGTAWSQPQVLRASDAANDYFGWSVATSGSVAVVGAYRKKSFTGAAYVFANTGSAWSQQAELTAPDAVGGSFGESVALYSASLIVGAGGTGSNTGTAYAFSLP